MDELLQNLYAFGSEKFRLGDFETFKQKLATPEGRKSFYEAGTQGGLYLGAYNDFEGKFGVIGQSEAKVSQNASNEVVTEPQPTYPPEPSKPTENTFSPVTSAILSATKKIPKSMVGFNTAFAAIDKRNTEKAIEILSKYPDGVLLDHDEILDPLSEAIGSHFKREFKPILKDKLKGGTVGDLKETLQLQDRLKVAKTDILDGIQKINEYDKYIQEAGIQTDIIESKDLGDAFARIGNAVGDQIPMMAVALLGGSSVMEAGNNYIQQLYELADKNGITPLEVIEKGLDSPEKALSAGQLSGLLDQLGAGNIASGLKNAIQGTIKKAAIDYMEKVAVEGGTEGLQNLVSQNSLIDAGARENVNWKEFLSEVVNGAVVTGAISSPSLVGGSRNVDKSPEAKTSTEKTPTSTITKNEVVAESEPIVESPKGESIAGVQPIEKQSLTDNGIESENPTSGIDGSPTGTENQSIEVPIEVPKSEGKVDTNLVEHAGSQVYGRIKPKPIEGIEPKKLRKIQLDLSKGLTSKIFYTKSPSSRRSLGSYNPRNAAIAIKYDNDLDTTAHELGHALDDKFGLLSAIPPPIEAQVKKELKAFSKFGSKPPKGHPKADQYVMGEGVAEWIRAFIVNPEDATKQAPTFAKWYSETVPEKYRNRVETFSNDVRAFAGATGHQAVMSNVAFDPEKTTSVSLKSLFNRNKEEGFKLTYIDGLKANWTNSMNAFEKASNYLTDINKTELQPSKDPNMLARLYLGSNEKVDNILTNGLIDSQNNRLKDSVTGENVSFEWLIRPLDATTKKGLQREVEEVTSFMIAERTLELGKRFEKDLVTGIGGGIFTDASIAKKRLEEHKNQPEQKQERIEEAARRYREYSDGVLQYMVGKGRLSQEVYNQIKANNDYYVALNRIVESAPDEEVVVYQLKTSRAIGNAKEVVKAVKGSSKTIKNPYESLLETTHRAIKEADRNEVMLAFKDLFTADRRMGEGEVVTSSEIARKATSADKNTIKIFVDGKAEFWQLQEDVYTAVKNLGDAGFVLPGLLTGLPKLIRWTVTNFPAFALRNKLRDIQARFILSDTNPFKGFDIYTEKGVKTQTRDGYQLFGGGQAGYYLINKDAYYSKLEESVAELAKDKNVILLSPKKLAEGYKKVLTSSETSTRLEEYRSAFIKAKSRGTDDYNASIYAAYQSRDLMDFAVAGNYMKVINQLIPFSNAAVQGLRKAIKTAHNDPKGFAVRVALYTLIPAVIERSLVSAADKDDEYEQFSGYRKDLYWNVYLGDGKWLSVPKPFELGVFASASGRLIDSAKGDEKAFEGFAGSSARMFIPVDESAIAGFAKGLIEAKTNYDFFRDKPIIPTYEENLDVELRNTQWASRIGEGIQNTFGFAGIEVDARLADHVVQSTLTYFGRTALKLSDIGEDESRYSFNLSDLGIFQRTPIYNSRDVQWVLNHAKEKGLQQNKLYRPMQDLIKLYFDEADTKIQKQVGETIILYAKDLRELWGNQE